MSVLRVCDKHDVEVGHPLVFVDLAFKTELSYLQNILATSGFVHLCLGGNCQEAREVFHIALPPAFMRKVSVR